MTVKTPVHRKLIVAMIPIWFFFSRFRMAGLGQIRLCRRWLRCGGLAFNSGNWAASCQLRKAPLAEIARSASSGHDERLRHTVWEDASRLMVPPLACAVWLPAMIGSLKSATVKVPAWGRNVDCTMRLPATSSRFDRFFVANDPGVALGLGVDVDFYLRDCGARRRSLLGEMVEENTHSLVDAD